MTTTAESVVCDREEIIRAMKMILEPGQVVEIRALDASSSSYRRSHVESGYFDDADRLADAVVAIERAKGIYFTPNPCDPALLSRAVNRIRPAEKEPTTSDQNIIRRRWLLVDCDPVRPSGISSTDAEHDAAIEMAREISIYLAEHGWPMPILADSGNGAHLLYRIDLPADDGGLCQRCLDAIHKEFSTELVKVDVTTFNPARIWKLYGTISRKGDPTAERPHRLARIIEVPDNIELVSVELLEALAAKAAKPANGHAYKGDGDEFNIRNFIARHFPQAKESSYKGGTKYQLDCPFDSSHRSPDAVIYVAAGGISFKCSHNSCARHDWHELRAMLEPGCYDRQHKSASPKDRREQNTDDNGQNEQTSTADSAAPDEKPQRFTFHTAGEFDTLDLRRDYHIPGILAAGPVPTVLAGSFKTLKTSIAMDLAISVATGSAFLRHFTVTKPCPVAIMSGESGGFALQSLARRVAHSKGWIMSSIGSNLRICTAVPDAGSRQDISRLQRTIDEHEIGLLFLDPAYLMMRGLRSDDAGNLFAMAQFLDPVARLSESTGCTICIIHHNSRGATRANVGEPAELADIAWSGFAEWAGQWLLLSRRERFDPDSNGEHRLWLSAGGRDGHSNLVGVDIVEGRSDEPGGMQWAVTVERASKARHEAAVVVQDQREQDRKARLEKQVSEDRETIMGIVSKLLAPDTKTALRDRSGLRSDRFNAAFSSLLEDGSIVPKEVKKGNGRSYDGYIASEHQDASGRNGTQPGCPGDRIGDGRPSIEEASCSDAMLCPDDSAESGKRPDANASGRGGREATA